MGFATLALSGQLSHQTIVVIGRLAKVDIATVVPPSLTEGPFQDYRQALPAITLSHDREGGPSLERLLCLALIRYSFNAIPKTRPRSAGPHTLSSGVLRPVLDFPMPAETAKRSCLLWVWLIAIDTQNSASGGLALEAAHLMYWIPRKFVETTRWSVSDFEYFGTQFFWTKSLTEIFREYWGREDKMAREFGIGGDLMSELFDS